MPRWLKISLVVFLLGGLAVFGSCSACAYWLKGASEELKVEMAGAVVAAKAEYAKGRKLGAGLDDANLCLDHGKEAIEACANSVEGSFIAKSKCVNTAKFYVRGCVDTAPRHDAFCEGIPRQLDLQQLITTQMEKCTDVEDKSCPTLFQTQVEICESRAHVKEAQAAETLGN